MTVRAVVICVSGLLALGAEGLDARTVPVPRHEVRSALSLQVRQDGEAPVALATPQGQRPRQVSARRPSPESHAERPWWGWILLGRLHPMVVHVPIGLLTITAVIEALNVWRRRPVPSEAGTYCLAFGVAGALVSVGLGTINASHQTFSGDSALTMERHQMMGWMAVLAATAALGAGQIARRAGRFRTMVVYLGLVAATSAVVGATGHLGGELVYGPGYLTDVLPWRQDVRHYSATPTSGPSAPAVATAGAAARAQADAVDFSRDVRPILEKTCIECHGPEKVKARLRMDSVAGLQKGGKNGALFKPGDPENSLIMRRVLGLDGEDQMPLDKDPLTEAQIDTLRRWIAAGAVLPAGSND